MYGDSSLEQTIKHVSQLDVGSGAAAKSNTQLPNFQKIEGRRNVIDELTAMLAQVKKLTGIVAAKLSMAKEVQSEELAALESFISRVKNDSNNTAAANGNIDNAADSAADSVVSDSAASSIVGVKTWTTVARGGKKVKLNENDNIASAELDTSPGIITTANPVQRIKITEALTIAAIPVATFDRVANDGQLYYVESTDHFAFRLNGRLLHGNIGTIYIDEAAPARVKNCKFAAGSCRRSACDYYHPPVMKQQALTRQPREYRNYVASSWLYAPIGSGRSRARRFGSRPNLDIDIVDMQGEDVERFHDQVMHDLLCSMILHYAYQP